MAEHRPTPQHSSSRGRSHDTNRTDTSRPSSNRSNGDAANRSSATSAGTPVDLEASFADLGVPAEVCVVLERLGIDHPFPIQSATLPDSLRGRDVLGRGRTGSGKTLAFVLPMITRLAENPQRSAPKHPRALILAPTRELVAQIHDAIKPLADALDLRSTTVFGGVSAGPQVTAFRRGVDIVVACPGRLEDLMRSRDVSLDAIEITVLDEADHMADLGFLPVVKKLMDQTPQRGQRLLFSATLDNGIDVLVKRYLSNPITHSVDSEQSPVDTMTHHVLHVRSDDRLEVLLDLTSAPGRKMIFTRTKHRAKQLTKQLNAAGVPAVEMHGNLAQNARTRNLAAFSDGRATAMVATDIAARGIHVDDVELVIHADPPIEHKAYLHRSGRTARAGNAGTVVTLAAEDQRGDVKQLARRAGIQPTITSLRPGDPFLTELAPGPRTRLTREEMAAALPVAVPQQQGPGGGGARRRRPAGGGAGGGRPGGASGGGRSSSGRPARAGGGAGGSTGGRPGGSAGGGRSNGGAQRGRGGSQGR